MNCIYFIFYSQVANALFMLEELPLLFKKLNSNECKMSLNTNIQEKTPFISNEVLFNTYTQTLTTYQQQTITVYDNIPYSKTDTVNKPYRQTDTVDKPTLQYSKTIEVPTNILEKSGKASFYFRVGNDEPGCPKVQTFNDGKSYGPCNNGNGVKYNGDSETKYWVAIKNAELYCGQTITISYQTNSIKLKVMDKCPSCSDYDLDMSLDALIELTGSVEKACSINTTPPIISWDFN